MQPSRRSLPTVSRNNEAAVIDLARNEARYIALLYRRLMKVLDRELGPLGLGHGRYAYLFALYNEDGQSQQSLADRVGADKAAATRALARLESDGFIVRSRDPDDRRVTRVHLSESGVRTRARLELAGEAAIACLSDALDEAQAEQFRELLETACAPILNAD